VETKVIRRGRVPDAERTSPDPSVGGLPEPNDVAECERDRLDADCDS